MKTGAAWGFMSRGMNELVSIPTSMLLARMLSPHDFGVAAAAAFFIQIAHRLTNFGINTALIQLKEVDRTLASTVFFLNLAAGAAVWALLTFGATWLGAVFNSQDAATVMPVVALSFLVGPFGAIPTALLMRDLRFREIVVLEWLATWTAAVSSVALAWFGYGYWSLVSSQLIAVVLATSARVWVTKWWPLMTFSRESLRQVFGFGMGLHAKRLLDSVAQNIDNLVVGRALGVTALGFYDKSFMMMNRTVLALSSAGPAVSFRVLSIIGEDDDRFRRGYRKLLLISTFTAYPVFAALIVVAPELFAVMFGSQWSAAVLPFRILCLVGALKFLNGYASTAIQARGVIWGEVWRQTAYVVAIIIGAFVGARYGLVGVAGGVLVATVVMTAALHDFLRRTTSVWWADIIDAQIPAFVCAAGLVLCLVVLRVAVQLSWPGGVAPLMLLATGAAVCLLYALGFVRLNPFPELRSVVFETVSELAPGFLWIVSRPSLSPDVAARKV